MLCGDIWKNKVLWNLNNLDIFLDITTACNAACPMCIRTGKTGKRESWIPKIEWSIEDFKKAIPPNVCQASTDFQICGSTGDPIINKDIIKMVEHIRNNCNSSIRINTNGSLRDENFWWELGVIGGKKLMVEFAVEGIDQEMHEKYRQKTNLEKILNNMDIISNTKANVETQTIVFKHNQKYLEDIEELCVKHGSVKHRHIYTDRWQIGKDGQGGSSKWDFVNSKGIPDTLEKAETEQKLKTTKHEQKNIKNKTMAVTKIRRNDALIMTNNIKCEWGNINKVAINPDGQVMPCCFIALSMYPGRYPTRKGQAMHREFRDTKLWQKYNNDDHNVFKKNLLDILKDSSWFNNHLPESWNNEPAPICKRFCSA